MLDIKGSADYLSRSTGSFSNFSMLFAGNNDFLILSSVSCILSAFCNQKTFQFLP